MGIDAMALLRIRELPHPPEPGSGYSVSHRGDCSFVITWERLRLDSADGHARHVRDLLGAAFDLHDDPRGVLITADNHDPSGTTYDELVAELEAGGAEWGVWNRDRWTP